MKKKEKSIMGQAYVLACPEDSETQMHEAVARVDAALCRIRDAGELRARERIAVLAALNLAFDIIQQEQQAQAMPLALPLAEDGAPSEEQLQAQARLQTLMARIDEALAEDGRLI